MAPNERPVKAIKTPRRTLDPVWNRQNLPLGSTASFWENRAIMSEIKNQCSLTGTALSTCGGAKTQSLSLASPSPQRITLCINGERREFEVGRDLLSTTTLSAFLRERLGYTGLKISCDEGACGACTIIMDGKAVLSCMLLAVEADGHNLLTIEGLPDNDPVIEAFAEQCEPGHGTALQCGYCTPGFVMTARALLNENPSPTLEEVKEALSGNLCRCGCYAGIAMAVRHAAEKIAAKGGRT
jgi:carbon-monoxide dehydrogenase small subunit